MSKFTDMFGITHTDIWKGIAKEVGAELKEGSWFTADSLVYKHKNWQLVLDAHVSTDYNGNRDNFVTMKAPFVSHDGFRFKVYREGITAMIGKLFGMQDIKIGSTNFDLEFIIKSNDEAKVISLLEDEKIRKLLHRQDDVFFEIRDDDGFMGANFPEGIDMLYFKSWNINNDKELIKKLFELFCLTLERLVELEIISECQAEVKYLLSWFSGKRNFNSLT